MKMKTDLWLYIFHSVSFDPKIEATKTFNKLYGRIKMKDIYPIYNFLFLKGSIDNLFLGDEVFERVNDDYA